MWKPPQNFVETSNIDPPLRPQSTVSPGAAGAGFISDIYLFCHLATAAAAAARAGTGASLGALLCYYVIIYLAPAAPRTTTHHATQHVGNLIKTIVRGKH